MGPPKTSDIPYCITLDGTQTLGDSDDDDDYDVPRTPGIRHGLRRTTSNKKLCIKNSI
jgi:hypothetical protein